MFRGSIPRSSQALTTPSLRGMHSSSMSSWHFDFPAHSLRVLASPPLVGSFMATIPPTRRPFSIILLRGCTSDSMTLSNPYPSLNERRAMPWSPMYPETIMTSPGRVLESEHHLLSTFLYELATSMSWSR